MVLWRAHKLSNADKRFSSKLAPKYEGPFKIIEYLPPSMYELLFENNRRVSRVYVSDLKQYIPPRGKQP